MSGQTWRPLPRREWSVREDYHVLIGTNRHTIGPTGWLQEENNLKAVLEANRGLAASHPYLGREYGVARYERLKGANFAAADRYFACTQGFWREVRQAWDAAFEREDLITLRGPVDKRGLFVPLFERADEIAQLPEEAGERAEDRTLIRGALENMGVPMPAEPSER